MKQIIIIFALIFVGACSSRKPDILRYKKTIGMKVKLAMLHNAIQNNQIISFNKIL